MKKNIRILGVDDAPFRRDRDDQTELVMTVMRMDFKIEGIIIRKIMLDGYDSTDAIIDILNHDMGESVNLVMTDGITFGGMNICDLDEVYEESQRPVISVTRREPDKEALISAIEKHHSEPQRGIDIIRRSRIEKIEIGNRKSIYVNLKGIEISEARRIIEKTRKEGLMPEPVRISHLIGSAIKYGKSRGRA
ncbi:MAG: DUF99 family protein [Candidatus Thermoplasmatota archaeon]|jgi:endonuclease V-like protein UPF0215 family|nr:DUF99 family protein [Candidatus Thermoplasmatota archaeon]